MTDVLHFVPASGKASRSVSRATLVRRGRESVLVVGSDDLTADLLRDVVRDGSPRQTEALTVDTALLKDLIRRERVSRIIVAEPGLEMRHDIASALLECRLLGVDVLDTVDVYQRACGKILLRGLEPSRLVYADGFHITPLYLRLKRALDVVCALALLLLAAPIMAALALLIRLESPGPVLFRQERVGQHGQPFTLYKFRSMVENAESQGARWAQKNDARVTRIGSFLRRSHLDELPQIWNVLRGDLSFVGPRPERQCFVDLLHDQIPFYDLRHYVKPGVTGWAQVCYPYAASIEDSYEKTQYDLYYAKHVSLALDVSILIRTAVHVVTGRGR